MTRMLIIGPPAGKGTQAERISECLDVVAISTGDIFRANVKGGTTLGIEAKKYMDAGDFVPDSVTNKMVRDRLGEADVETASCSTATPAPPRRWSTSTKFSPKAKSSTSSCS
jgi:adenylate kinase